MCSRALKVFPEPACPLHGECPQQSLQLSNRDISFEASLGYQHPLFSVQKVDLGALSVQDLIRRCQNVWQDVCLILECTQETSHCSANKHRNSATKLPTWSDSVGVHNEHSVTGVVRTPKQHSGKLRPLVITFISTGTQADQESREIVCS